MKQLTKEMMESIISNELRVYLDGIKDGIDMLMAKLDDDRDIVDGREFEAEVLDAIDSLVVQKEFDIMTDMESFNMKQSSNQEVYHP